MTVPHRTKLARHAGDLDDDGHDIYGFGGAAADVTVADAGGYFTGTDVEAVLQELASKVIGYTAHGALGSTETFSALVGWHSGTFSANCTATFSGATSGLAASMVLELESDGSSVMTWPMSVVWPGGVDPTLSTTPGDVDIVLLMTRDGGTTWYGFPAGGGGTSITDIVDLPTAETDTTLRLAPDGAGGVEWASGGTSGFHYEALMVAGTSPAEAYETPDGDWLYVLVAD